MRLEIFHVNIVNAMCRATELSASLSTRRDESVSLSQMTMTRPYEHGF